VFISACLALQRSYVVAGKRTVSDADMLQQLMYGKVLMDDIRVETDAMRAEEQDLLDDRIADINAIRLRDYISVTSALVTALA
jgi:CHASE3 domain sensor protein